jgi:hypothetical protein
MSMTSSSSDGGRQDTLLRDTFTPNDSEEGDVASQRQQDEAIFAEDPFAQDEAEPYVVPVQNPRTITSRFNV